MLLAPHIEEVPGLTLQQWQSKFLCGWAGIAAWKPGGTSPDTLWQDVPSSSDLSTEVTQGGGSRAGQACSLLSPLTQGYKMCRSLTQELLEELGAEAGSEPGALPADTPRTLPLLTLTLFQTAESCKS